jgi:2-polyprenyl-3-methyl-5-hydroxy-6-metoxy-1,4-benzoquinol methylase
MSNRFASYIERASKPQKDNVLEDMHFRLALDFIERHISEGKQYRLLDIGCNVPPAFLRCVTGKHDNIRGFGCDIREGTVEAEAVEDRIEIRLLDISEAEDAYSLDFFDFVFAGEVIEHLKETDRLVTRASDYLKPGGYLILTTPNLAAWYERILLASGILPIVCEVSDTSRVFGRRLLYRMMGKVDSKPVGHLRLFTPSALRELCEYHGLEFVQHNPYWTMDFFLNRWISRMSVNLAQGIFMVFRKPLGVAAFCPMVKD